MLFRGIARGIVAGVLVGALTAAAATAQTVKFEQNLEPGQSIAFDTQMRMQMGFNVSAQGQVMQRMDQKVSQNRGGRVDILEVRDGAPAKVRATFAPNCGGVVESMGQSQQMPFSLAGQTITISKGQMGELIIDHDANIDPGTMDELKTLLERPEALFPERVLQVGEEFEVGAAAIRKTFAVDNSSQASARGKLLEVRQQDGRQQARVSLTANIQTKVEGMIDLDMRMQGEGWFDVQSSRMIEGQLQGPLKISGQAAQPMEPGGAPVQLQFAGDGQFAYSQKGGISSGGAAPAPLGGPGPVVIDRPADGLPNPFDQPAPGPAAAKPSLAGTYNGDGMTLVLSEQGDTYAGTVELNGQKAQFQQVRPGADGAMQGKFQIGNNAFDFSLAPVGDGLVFTTGRSSYNLKRAAPANPFDP